MQSLRERALSPSRRSRALSTAVLASVVYAALVLGYSAQSTEIQITGSLWASFAVSLVFAFGTIGVPILLWVCYRIRGPSVLMALVLLFWHVVIHLPVVGSSGGDAPAFAVVLFWAPLYLVAYAVLAGGEYWLRRQNITVSLPTA